MTEAALFDVPAGVSLAQEVVKDAALSDCGRYRYRLTRSWRPEAGRLTFVMLNPSTADADLDDPTIRRCIGFTRDLGYGALEVVNLYAWRATKPADMWAAQTAGEDVTGGLANDDVLSEALRRAAHADRPVIAAWGAHARPDRIAQVLDLPHADRLHALAVTKAGQPRHPLYLPAVARPAPWSAPGP